MQTTIAPTKTRLAPTKIASDTYLIHDHQGEGHAPVCVPLNSLVIRGAEPIVVDTGMPEHRDQYLEDLFAIVEPDDIRWVFVSHDERLATAFDRRLSLPEINRAAVVTA